MSLNGIKRRGIFGTRMNADGDRFRKIEQVKRFGGVLKSSTPKDTFGQKYFREEEKIDERDHTEALHKTRHAWHGVHYGNRPGDWLVRHHVK